MIVVVNVELDLASGFLAISGTNLPIFLFYFDPGHPTNLIVNHESKRIQNIWLISRIRQLNKTLGTSAVETSLYLSAESGNVLRMLNVNFEENLRLVLVEHYGHSFANFNLHDCLMGLNLTAKLLLNLDQIGWCELVSSINSAFALENMCIEVRGEVVNVRCDRIPFLSHTKKSNHSLLLLFLIITDYKSEKLRFRRWNS